MIKFNKVERTVRKGEDIAVEVGQVWSSFTACVNYVILNCCGFGEWTILLNNGASASFSTAAIQEDELIGTNAKISVDYEGV